MTVNIGRKRSAEFKDAFAPRVIHSPTHPIPITVGKQDERYKRLRRIPKTLA